MPAYAEILISGCITLIVAVIGGALFKVLVKRSFDSVDVLVKNNSTKIEKLEEKMSSMKDTLDGQGLVTNKECKVYRDTVDSLEDTVKFAEKDIVRLQEHLKALDDLKKTMSSIEALKAEFHEKFLPKTDFIREIQLLSSQLETIFKKIDHVDEQVEKKIASLRSQINDLNKANRS